MWILITFAALLVAIHMYTYPRAGQIMYKCQQQLLMLRHGFRERSYRVNGIPIIALENASYQVHDNRPLLILLHGMAADKSVWLPMACHLRDRFHVVIPDLPGHGETGFSHGWDYSIKAQAQRLVALIWQLGYQQAHVVGNSMGGQIAAYMAIHHASAVSSISLVCPAGLHGDTKSELVRDVEQGKNPFLMKNTDDFYQFFDLVMARPPWVPEVVKDAMAATFIDNRDAIERVFGDFIGSGFLDEEALRQLKTPVFVIWGSKDQLIDVSALQLWQQLTDCEYTVFYDLGHMPMLEAPRRTAFALSHFYTRINGYESIKMPARLEDFYKNLPL